MEVRDYIESGILELYVYGTLSDDEAAEVAKMASEHQEVRDEIENIERAMISLSSGFSPNLPSSQYIAISQKLKLKNTRRKSGVNLAAIFGWTIALLFLAGAAYLYLMLNEARTETANAIVATEKLQDSILGLDARNRRTEFSLGALRDINNHVVLLGGQKIAPEAVAKVYWNMKTQAVFVDAAGLPEPPEGKVYQVWALKYRPLRPTNVGLLDRFSENPDKIFSVDNAVSAQAFCITLEPEGGSESPTFDQMYVIGKAF